VSIDKSLGEVLKDKLREDEEAFNLALKLYKAYLEGGRKRIHEIVLRELKRYASDEVIHKEH